MTALVWTDHRAAVARRLRGRRTPVRSLALVGFVTWELVTAAPDGAARPVPPRTFSGGSLSLALVQIGNGGLLLVLTQYLQFVLGFSPMQAGLAFIPLAVASLVFNPSAPPSPPGSATGR